MQKNTALNMRDLILIQKSYQTLSENLPDLVRYFLLRLEAIDPTLQIDRGLDGSATELIIKTMIETVLSRLDNLAALTPWLIPLGKKYAANGVHTRHYATIGNALLQTLDAYEMHLLDCDTKYAWLRLYDAVVDILAVSVRNAKIELAA